MVINKKSALRGSLVAALLAVTLFLLPTATNAQEAVSAPQQPAQAEVAGAKTPAATATTPAAAPAPAPVFTDYKGVTVGMNADDVRGKLNHLKEKGKLQDFFVFSDNESAQVFYDDEGKVKAIAITYIGENHDAPSPKLILGEEVQAKPDGSLYELKRYPAAGYWVAYSRTAGDHPVITVTVQKMQ